ncbi:hypothetical protein OIE66_40560 [Nonomuraea sp. NBC_01738]|uniref:hypothetical protein n=1 Tax=Nonomuraea sp. NBC_01738 TaxID=2976003 RepID=UPI002E0D9A68|nr:hypothetical protein OIE66_40560 [Nonomuraea sp. NBC_01738]
MSIRGGDGRYDRDPDVALRDARACEMRARNMPYSEIAAELGISKSQAWEGVQRALADTVREPADDVRRLELLRLDELARAAREVMGATHYVVSQGKVVRLTRGGAPLEDDGPVLAAIDRLLKIQERRARLLGLDSPQRVSIEAQQLGDEVRGLIAALLAGDQEDDPDGEDDDGLGDDDESDAP